MVAGAVLLPYVAVVLANQADQRTRPSTVEPGAPADAPQLGTGSALSADAGGEIIEGTVDDDTTSVRGRTGEPGGRIA